MLMIHLFVDKYITKSFYSALADIMLLTPSQFSKYTRDHFNDKVLNEWYKSILSTLIVDVEKEAQDISSSLNDVI